MNTENLQFDDNLRKASKKAAWVTALGAIILFASLAFGIYQLSYYNDAVAEKIHELESLKNEEQALIKQLSVLRENYSANKKSILELERRVDEGGSKKLREMIKETTPLSAIIIPQAKAEPIPGRLSRTGQQIYNFSLWIDLPEERKSEIEKVRYEFNHPTFKDKINESVNPGDGFRIGYQGWGCLTRVIITMYPREGEPINIDFDMCRALGFYSERPTMD